MAQQGHSSARLEISFFPPFGLQAGRDDPEEAMSPLHLVLHQFSTNSSIKMGKGGSGRSEQYEATLWLKFAPHQSSSQAQLGLCPRQNCCSLRLRENQELVFGLKSPQTSSKALR